MINPTLTLIDVRRVQTYLFNANELKQNLGASAIVEQATHEWIFEALPPRRNADWDSEKYDVVFDDRTIDKDHLDAEVIYVGGGNAGILFSTHKEALDFTQRYTDFLLVRAPGLEAAVAHVQEVDLSKRGALKKAWQTLQRVEMPPRKEGRLIPQPVLGLSVTAECAYTGLPAVAEEKATDIPADSRTILLSAESYAKQNKETVKQANRRLNTLLKINDFEYPLRFEDLGGERGSSSFLAVVHVDGNGMGRRIEQFVEDEDNRKMLQRMREFSQKLNQVGLEAIRSMRNYLAIRTIPDRKDRKLNEIADRYDRNVVLRLKDNFLPIRPLVFGGDDITFVCEGRLGLALASKVLEAFSKVDLPDELKRVYACAGVAIVHNHYPFARAYALAEQLCNAAKQQARQWDPEEPQDKRNDEREKIGSRLSLINWHITTAGLTLDWNQISEREYQNGRLLMRPLVVAKDPDVSLPPAWQTWQTFTEQICGFLDKTWSTQRNKQKELLETLRKGADATSKFTNLHGYLPEITASLAVRDAHVSGWLNEEQCLYFDALEAMDLFIYPEDNPNE